MVTSKFHFGIFPDTRDFQRWRVNFKTELCVGVQFPQLTVSWINEVEMAKSIDDLLTSQSIEGRRDFPDFEMLDAKIASALRKIIFNTSFKKESQCWRAASSKTTSIPERKTKLFTWSSATSKQSKLMMQLKEYVICLIFCLQNDDVQDFDTRWDQILLGTSKLPHNNVLQGSYKNWICRVPINFRLCWLCTIKNWIETKVAPSFQKLRMMTRQHVDQMIKTHNFRARKERFETGALVKSHKGSKRQPGRKRGRTLSVESNWTAFQTKLL